MNCFMNLWIQLEAIHLAVSRGNCFDGRHLRWLFGFSVWAETMFSQYKVDFVNLCVIFFNFCLCQLIATYLVQYVQQFVSPDHIPCIKKKNVFPCCLLFSRPNLQRIGPREEKGEKESLKKKCGTHTFLFFSSPVTYGMNYYFF